MPDEKTRNDYDDGNIPEVDLPGEDSVAGTPWSDTSGHKGDAMADDRKLAGNKFREGV